MSGFLLAGTHSGCGKSLVCLALMAFLRQNGLLVQPFKVGPDFIDPGHHHQICGRQAHNLDGWMLSRQSNLEIFQRHARQADVSVIEGVMGLFDGFSAVQESGSSAQIAKWLDLPVLLVLDAKSMARSVAALVQGYTCFDPELNVAGVICNRVGSKSHADLLRQSLDHYQQPPCLAFLPLVPGLEIPSRHLGLVTAQDKEWSEQDVQSLIFWLEQGMEQDLLQQFLESCIKQSPAQTEISNGSACFAAPSISRNRQRLQVRIGVAWDRAFCFYYQENLHLLEQAGAELCLFSPLDDQCLPRDLQGLYLGGGYPELYAQLLAANSVMRGQILEFACRGGVVYAECGGFMYLMQSIIDTQGENYPMVGFYRLQARMCARFQALGYREVVLLDQCALGTQGSLLRGHEFHYSRIEQSLEQCRNLYAVQDRKGANQEVAGWSKQNVLGSYIHLHFASSPSTAKNLTHFCALQA